MAAFDVGLTFGADTAPLEKDVKRGQSALKSFGGTAVATAKQLAGVTAAGLAVAGALTAIIKNSADSAREIQNLSMVSGTGAKEFQNYATGAKKLGIEQDKLADIFKDTRDKVGDFLATGQGPLADFFENIAPRVGITAEQFRRLSGPEALGLYVDSLEKANVSQNEMTFYMEAIASDATNLLPLLRNNAAALKQVTAESDALNMALSDTEIQQLVDAGDQFEKMQRNIKVVTDRLAVQLAPILQAVTDEIRKTIGSTDDMRTTFENAFNLGIKGAGIMADGVRGIQVVVQGLITGFHGFAVGVNTVFGAVSSAIDALINGATARIAQLIEAVNKLPGVDIDFAPAKSTAGEFFFDLAETSKNSMSAAAAELHELMMQPLPSESLDNWVASVQEASAKIAAEAVNARNEALAVPALSEEAEQARRDQLIASSEFNIATQQAEQDQLNSLAAESAEKRRKIQEAEAMAKRQVAKGMFDNLASLMQSGDKRLFAIGKASAIASAIVKGYEAAVGSYAQGAKIGGPVLGAAFAATSAVATGAMIAKIASQQPSGGGGGSVNVPSGGSVPAAAAPQQQAAPQQGPDINIDVVGSVFGRDTVVGLIGQINDALDDGANLNVRGA